MRGYLRPFGDQGSTHQLFAEHCTCEMAAPVTMGGRTFDKWGKRVGRDDNHLWDAVVGSGVAVAVAGLEWSSSMSAPKVKPRRKRISYAEQRAKIEARDRARAQQQ